jgi:FMN-dependent NADH-azoreductase
VGASPYEARPSSAHGLPAVRSLSHLLHIDSSIRVEGSVTRALSARAAEAWRAAHHGGTVTYRDLGASPIPHLDTQGGLARNIPPEQHTPAQAASWKLSKQLVDELKQADTILLGLPLYNFGAPSSVKAWVDHVVARGLSVALDGGEGLLAGRELIVLAARGGGYAPGSPRDGWDHAQLWLPHGIALTGLEPRFIVAELTQAEVNPVMSELIPLARRSRADAEQAVDNLWKPAAMAA